MTANPSIDPGLLDKAFAVRDGKTKTATVHHALQEFIAPREQRAGS